MPKKSNEGNLKAQAKEKSKSIDQQDQETSVEVASEAGVVQQNTSKVSMKKYIKAHTK
jgi:hypothetical protein